MQVRFEVPLPRGTTALRWLRGQQQAQQQGQAQGQQALPLVYFCSRQSSAADTPGTSEAERGLEGWSAVAGGGKGTSAPCLTRLRRWPAKRLLARSAAAAHPAARC